jgi:HAD superfamily hydrolase (TIGR01459 family)
MAKMIETLGSIGAGYGVILCDVWGVLHNGMRAFPDAVAALRAARGRGQKVVLITNSPRPRAGVAEQLALLDVPQDCYDAIVSSGDVTRKLIAEGPRRVFHLGPDRDLPLYDGIDVELSEEFEAQAVVCTGMFDDDEKPEDYADMLERFRARNLPFICANPDIVVERGDELIWCAGALARDYAQLGGRTEIAGKPHRPIYEAALAEASALLGREAARSEALAIGDGVLTDVKGAADNGIDVLFVSGGIHAGEYGPAHAPDPAGIRAFLQRHGYSPVAVIPRLR